MKSRLNQYPIIEIELKRWSKSIFLEVAVNSYNGDIPQAKQRIQDFCNKNPIVYRSREYGYVDLIFDKETLVIPPSRHGSGVVDMNEMLEFCGLNNPTSDKELSEDREDTLTNAVPRNTTKLSLR